MRSPRVVDGVQVVDADDPDSTLVWGWRTSHAMRAADNVVIDVRVTDYGVSDQAVRSSTRSPAATRCEGLWVAVRGKQPLRWLGAGRSPRPSITAPTPIARHVWRPRAGELFRSQCARASLPPRNAAKI